MLDGVRCFHTMKHEESWQISGFLTVIFLGPLKSMKCFRTSVGKLQPTAQTWFAHYMVFKRLLEHSHCHLLIYYQWLLSRQHGRAEWL